MLRGVAAASTALQGRWSESADNRHYTFTAPVIHQCYLGQPFHILISSVKSVIIYIPLGKMYRMDTGFSIKAQRAIFVGFCKV